MIIKKLYIPCRVGKKYLLCIMFENAEQLASESIQKQCFDFVLFQYIRSIKGYQSGYYVGTLDRKNSKP